MAAIVTRISRLGRPVDGHVMLLNHHALDLAHITPRTSNPAGGEILRDDRGERTGL